MLTEKFYFLNPKLPLRFPFSSSLGYTLTVRPAFVLFNTVAARKSSSAPKRLTTTGKPEKFSGVDRQARHRFRAVLVCLAQVLTFNEQPPEVESVPLES